MAESDRLTGLVGNAGCKVPCRAASTGALVLIGEQSVDGVACVTGDRVLVKNQADQTKNGIYVVDTGAWTRAKDCDGAYDLVRGSVVFVTDGGTNAGLYFACTSVNPITFGSSTITWAVASVVVPALLATQVVDTIVALKALAAPTSAITAFVRGYNAIGDGGGGFYWWNAADITADNGGTIIQLNAGGNGRFNKLF